jgi:tRNA threonylcarbamoyladenosine biosynthesis protein TsaB
LNILVIDTATKIEIAAASSGSAFSDKINTVSVSHSITLFDSIDLALKEIQLQLKDINVIGVGIGPGSFTGIRIAVTTARMFSQIFNLPLIGIKTHLMYAASVCDKAKTGENILIAFDAKKGRVFGALYKKEKDYLNPSEIVEPGDYSIEYLLNFVNLKEKTILIGDGCEKYNTEIIPRIQDHELLSKFIPSGKTICGLVEKIYLENSGNYSDLNHVLPFYARRSDAEILKEKR